MVLHFMPFMALSVRFRSLAGILTAGLACRSPLRLQQIPNQAAQQSNNSGVDPKTDSGLSKKTQEKPDCHHNKKRMCHVAMTHPRYMLLQKIIRRKSYRIFVQPC